MICLNDTDTLEAGASIDAVVDYTVHGLVGTTFTNIAQGKLSSTDPTILYTAGAAISIVSIIFVNTHSAAVTVNLYLDPTNAGTPRRLIPKALSLGIGHSMHFDGARVTVMDASGKILSSASAAAHNTTHQDGGTDEISVTGLSGLLADDQHVLDTEVLTAVEKTNLAIGFSVAGGTDPKTLTVDKTVATSAVAEKSDIAVDANLSAAAQDAITKRHTQGTDVALGGIGTKNPPIDADKVIYRDSADSDALVTSTWAQVKAFLKTYFDTIYEALGSVATHAGLTETHGATGAVVGTTNTQTLTNKRITPRITTITSHATPTINTDNCDAVTITAQAEAITSMTTNLSGTPVNFQKLIFRIKDNGTLRAITWGAKFVAKGVALPTTTVAAKLLTVGFIYDTVAGTWGCVASVQEA